MRLVAALLLLALIPVSAFAQNPPPTALDQAYAKTERDLEAAVRALNDWLAVIHGDMADLAGQVNGADAIARNPHRSDPPMPAVPPSAPPSPSSPGPGGAPAPTPP